ncbi:MAG: hypothetical protein SNJ77_09795 [Cytophagales bacterium]
MLHQKKPHEVQTSNGAFLLATFEDSFGIEWISIVTNFYNEKIHD